MYLSKILIGSEKFHQNHGIGIVGLEPMTECTNSSLFQIRGQRKFESVFVTDQGESYLKNLKTTTARPHLKKYLNSFSRCEPMGHLPKFFVN